MVKRRIFASKKIRICPKCKQATLRPATSVSGWLAPDMFECSECKYVGRFYIEIDPEDYELGEENESNI